MEREFCEAFYLLERAWKPYGRVTITPVTATHHFYTDGTACGSCWALHFEWPSGKRGEMRLATGYLFPNGHCWWSAGTKQLNEIVGGWVTVVRDNFDPALSRARTAERVGCFKEELVAASWKPERVARWIGAGLELEDL